MYTDSPDTDCDGSIDLGTDARELAGTFCCANHLMPCVGLEESFLHETRARTLPIQTHRIHTPDTPILTLKGTQTLVEESCETCAKGMTQVCLGCAKDITQICLG